MRQFSFWKFGLACVKLQSAQEHVLAVDQRGQLYKQRCTGKYLSIQYTMIPLEVNYNMVRCDEDEWERERLLDMLCSVPPDELSGCRTSNNSFRQVTGMARNTLYLVVSSSSANETGNYTCVARNARTNELLQSRSLFISVSELLGALLSYSPLSCVCVHVVSHGQTLPG